MKESNCSERFFFSLRKKKRKKEKENEGGRRRGKRRVGGDRVGFPPKGGRDPCRTLRYHVKFYVEQTFYN